MKLFSIIRKSMKEQIRSFWVLLLTLSMGPFFIFVYYLIIQSSEPQYNILWVNNDQGIMEQGQTINHGQRLIASLSPTDDHKPPVPFHSKTIGSREEGIDLLKNKKADALIILPQNFSAGMQYSANSDSAVTADIEFTGDLTHVNYLISAVWVGDIINEYTLLCTGARRIVRVKETALGTSATISNFDMVVPGILILSLIMLMFTASIAFVSEVENKTIIRLKLSTLNSMEFLGGIGVVQLIVGIASVLLTLATAIALGFHYSGSLNVMILIAALTSLSIISFSLIIAAITRTANEVLVVGNFPMFLFMFFTGAAFPMKSEALFTIAGYPVTVQGLLTPTHAISALNKTMVMNMDIKSIIPEITAIMILTVIYFLVGAIIFKQRHLKLG